MNRSLRKRSRRGFAALEASIVCVILITVILSFAGVAQVLFFQRSIDELVSQNSGDVNFSTSQAVSTTTRALQDVLVEKLRSLGFSNPADYRIQVSRLVLPASGTCDDVRHTSLMESGSYTADSFRPIEAIFKDTRCQSLHRIGSTPSASGSLEGARELIRDRTVLGIQVYASLRNTMAGSVLDTFLAIPDLSAVEFSYLRGE